jgi:hypothetical protein
MTRDDRECAVVGRPSRRFERLGRLARRRTRPFEARDGDLADAGVGADRDLAVQASGDVGADTEW